MDAIKIAPELLLAFQAYKSEGRVDFSTHSIRTLNIERSADSPESPKVNVFLHCDESAELDHLDEEGVQVNTRKGRIRTARLSLENLERLYEDPNIIHVGASHKLHPLMDVASDRVQLPEFRNRTGLTGEGVIIGVVDTGIDSEHPAFHGRILRILDQTLSPGIVPYGQELTAEGLIHSPDTDGHGTHVAGIAAGNDDTFGGVAPEAELVIVKSTLWDTDILEGIRYIFEFADKLGKPAVVNLSLGGHYDPHDGSDELSRGIDELSGEGRIVCCSAGNEGNYNIHAQTHLSQNGDSRSIRFSVPQTSGSNAIEEIILNGWYSVRDHIEVAIQSPSGARTDYQGILSGNALVPHDSPDAYIYTVTPEIDSTNQDRSFTVTVNSGGSDRGVAPGIWKLWLHGRDVNNTQVDMWVLDGKNPPQVVFTGRSVSDSMKIGSPGAARRAITVASYTTQNEWSDIDGRNWQTGLALNDISDFSSEGPLRNGGQKPDVAAPGAYIASCMSDDVDQQPRWRQINSHYTMMAGTSMSAPFISGIVALLLQHDPTFSPERIKALLQASSSIHGNRPGRFHPKWGYGLIDADLLANALDSFAS